MDHLVETLLRHGRLVRILREFELPPAPLKHRPRSIPLQTRLACQSERRREHEDVGFGSWLCENAKALERDRRSYSSKAVLALKLARGFNL
ncbi:hypothetical protein, partial [Bradyrhizobium sp. NAS80.1]|uniref:hypothetical protein n=1 Tax=Bradyrhizobium sp. NAS80.1 TaxID=1680159 RepID=UPI001AEF938B